MKKPPNQYMFNAYIIPSTRILTKISRSDNNYHCVPKFPWELPWVWWFPATHYVPPFLL